MAAYNESGWWIDQLCEYLHENDLLLEKTIRQALPQLPVTRLEGTYLVWLDIRPLGISSDAVTRLLLDTGKVLVNSGTMYGTTAGEGFIRINIACPRSQLEEALQRICDTLKNIRPT